MDPSNIGGALLLDYNQAMCTYADSRGMQTAPMDWSHNGVTNVTQSTRNIQQHPLANYEVVDRQKDTGAPCLRMLINEVEMLVQQVEENLGSEKVQEFIEASSSNSSRCVLSDDKSLSNENRCNATTQKAKRCRKFEVDRERWRRNSNKRKRMTGNAYESLKKTDSKKCEYVTKDARKMGSPCNCPMSKKSKLMLCNELDEGERTVIFNNFWKNMTWGEKKVYVSTLVETVPVKQHKALSMSETPRRDKSLIFHLMKGNERIRVCKTMFLNTLDLGEWSVRHWVENSAKIGVSFANSSSKKHSVPSENRQHIIDFLKLLPTVKSPHCRADNKKQCLEPVWQSINEVYREYVKHCTIRGYDHLSHTSFRHEFAKLNYSLYKPKKDQPEVDTAIKEQHITEEVISSHQMVTKQMVQMAVEEQPPMPTTPPEPKPTPKRAKRFEVDEMCWKRNSNKRKRMSGIAYESIKKTSGKYEYVKKEARKIGEPCNCSLSKRSSKMKCDELSESDRNTIFDNFWKNMTWGQKKVYVASLVEAVPVKQHRALLGPENSRRDKSLIFHLLKDNTRVRVCKTMFLNTLSIGEWSVRHWVLNSSEPEAPASTSKSPPEPSPNKQRIIQFLKHLPTLQSHYSNSDKTKWYLEPNWQSINDVYRAYIKHCVDNGFDHLSHTSFRFEFARLNYALYKPK